MYVHQGTTRQEAAEVYEAMSKAQHAQHGQAPQRSAFDLGKTMYSQLYELDLSGNSLGHRGAKLVAEVRPKWGGCSRCVLANAVC